MNVAIIMATRNRAESVRQTLAALEKLQIPAGMSVELVVVDNGSTDRTPQVLAECKPHNLPTTYVEERRPGVSRALNAALAAAGGDIILRTDDDVRPPADWIARMCAPILSGQAEVVAGGVRLAGQLERPWMTQEHRNWLADNRDAKPGPDPFVIGANMAVSRRVFDKIPGFDPEVGPGAIGHADDTLFTYQVREAGFRTATAYDVVVEHWPDPNRLLRAEFVKMARRRGHMTAYLNHHWRHAEMKFARAQLLRAWLTLAVRRVLNGASTLRREGIPANELQKWERYYFCRCNLVERRRTRNYSYRGLARRVPYAPRADSGVRDGAARSVNPALVDNEPARAGPVHHEFKS